MSVERLPRGVMPRTRGHLLVAAATAVCLFATQGWAAQNDPLDPDTAVAMALEAEPGLVAREAQAAAHRDRAVAAGALPDPSLRLALMNMPIQGGGFATEGMTQAQVGVRQMVPSAGARDARAALEVSRAAEQTWLAAGRQREVAAAVRRAWLQARHAMAEAAVLEAVRPLIADLSDVAAAAFTTGRRDRQRVLQAELEVARLAERQAAVQQRFAEARAGLAWWVGEPAWGPLQVARPAWSSPPPAAELLEAVPEHPAVQAATARVDTALAGLDVARAAYRPGWAVDLAYGYRAGQRAPGRDRSDMLSIGVSLDLPVFRRDRQDRGRDAAGHDLRAAEAARDALLRQLRSETRALHGRWADLERRLILYRDSVLPSAQQRAAAALDAYGADAADFDTVVQARIAALDLELEHLRLQLEQDLTLVQLAALGGFTP